MPRRHPSKATAKLPLSRTCARRANAGPVEIERADRLHRKFHSAERSLATGRELRQVFRGFSWYWRRRCYHCDPTRQVRFGYSTLLNLFYHWRKSGRTKECLYRRWRPVTPRRVTQAFLLEFVKFCTVLRTLSLLAAWKEFVASRKTLPPVTYSTILRYFSSGPYRRMQRALRSGKSIKSQLATVRHSIRARFAPKGGLTA